MQGSLRALEPSILKGEDKWVRSVCEMCSSRCAIEVRVVDQKPVWLQGNAFDTRMHSSICARGLSGVSQLYDQDRLRTPLMRVGQRGENRWREASWDEALAFVASSMQRLKQNYGAQSMLFSSKTGESFDLLSSFAANYGSPNTFSHWSSCPIAIESALEQTFGERVYRDFEHADYIVNFGHNLFEGLDIPLSKAMARFAANPSKKLIVLDPRFSIMAGKADEWYPIKAGQDLAFVLSLLHVWLRDAKYDHAFVRRYCIGLDALKASLKETTPQWQERYTGIDAKTIERLADEIYRAAPRCILDWGHKATTSPAEFQRTRAILIANVLMGNVEKKGGIYFAKTPEMLNALLQEPLFPLLQSPYPSPEVGIARIDGAGEEGSAYRFVPKKHGVLNAIADAILTQQPYAIKGWFLTRHNPLVTVADPQKMRTAMASLDLIVVNDIYMSDTAMMADVVLPESTYLERDESIHLHHGLVPSYTMRNRALTPLHRTRSLHEIVRSLADALGFSHAYPWKTMQELRAYQAKGNSALLESLVKRGYVQATIPHLFVREEASVRAFCERYAHVEPRHVAEMFERRRKTPSGKIELFCAHIEQAFTGYGVPCAVDMDVQQNYPYTLISGKSAIHTNGHTQNVPYLHALMSDNPLWMHPSTAKAHGLRQNDTCYIENEIGKEKVKVFLTEGIRPDTLFLYMGFGRQTPLLPKIDRKGSSASKLLPLKTAPVCGAMITNTGVRIVRA
ncbi:MAG: thiosulfate reductase PhsA [Sulfurospirillum cavolei]|nr:thiosulfate reductase PhsA [Sulfurospirillum cavolei]